MKSLLLVVVGVAGTIAIGVGLSRAFAAENGRPVTRHESSELIALSSDGGPEGQQQVIVISSQTRVMSVYHVEHNSGAITLKSVRNIDADLMMDEFNTGSPLPREIRAMLSNR